jgi:tellurite resistance protein TehA-like permease
VLRPRLSYDSRRWSTVFPVAMYAASSIVVARLVDSTAIRDFAHAWTWVALGFWLTIAAAEGRMVIGRRRETHPG